MPGRRVFYGGERGIRDVFIGPVRRTMTVMFFSPVSVLSESKKKYGQAVELRSGSVYNKDKFNFILEETIWSRSRDGGAA